MNYYKIIVIIFVLLPFTGFSQSGWYIQNSGTNKNLKSVFFVNNQTGYAVGDNSTILKTTDGGLYWYNESVNITVNLKSVFFTTALTGYVVGENGFISKTTNGGNNWFIQESNSQIIFQSIFFTDSVTGYIVGGLHSHDGATYKTTNGGLNWIKQSTGSANDLNSIFFVNSNTGFTSGIVGAIMRTSNSGVNWLIQNSGNTAELKSIYFIDVNNGFLAGGDKILRTSNSGLNWFSQSFSNNFFNSVRFLNSSTGFVVGSGGRIYYSSNQGTNWYIQTPVTSKNLNCIISPGSDTSYIVGDSGIILKNNQSRTIGIVNNNNQIPESIELYNYPNPFNNTTKIKVTVPLTTYGTLAVFDNNGRIVSVLFDGVLKSGIHYYSFDGTNYASGVYFLKMQGDNINSLRKIILLK